MVWSHSELENLAIHFEGKLYLDQSQTSEIARKIYSTDASVYQVKPIAVAVPANYKDIKRLILFAKKHKIKKRFKFKSYWFFIFEHLYKCSILILKKKCFFSH